MDDLISRQAAIDVASGYCHPANVAKELARLPSAEPEQPELIQCKDCIHWKPRATVGHCCFVHDWVSKGNDYCSFAERRENDTKGSNS